MTELILVRHGESEHFVRGLSGGWTDTPLTERGMQQTERAGQALAHVGDSNPARLLSSDLIRTRQTAEAIAQATGLTPSFHRQLREQNNGVAAGKTADEARALELPMTEPRIKWLEYAGAESWKDMSLRVMRFMDAEVTHDPKESTVIVSHRNSLIALVHWWPGIGEEHWMKSSYTFEIGSISRLTTNRFGEKVIAKLNDTSHLVGI